MNTAVRTFDAELPHGIRLACRGAGGGPARVVLLHGFPEAAFVWDDVMQRLAQRATCVAPNLRGFIGSSSPTAVADYRARDLIGDVAALIRQHGAPIDLLVAHDWGGALAWGLAASAPQLIKKLLIVNSPHPGTFLRDLQHDAAQQRASAYMNVFRRPDAEALLAENGHARLWRWFEGAGWMTDAVREQYRQAWSHGLTGPLNYYRASLLHPPEGPDDPLLQLVLPDDLVRVNVPTTVLWGERDHALLPCLLDGLGHWVPNLTVQRVPEATHWIVHEQPALVADTIGRLLD